MEAIKLKNKKGYKETKLGWIPEDWEVEKFKNIANFFSGGTPKTTNKQYYKGDIPFIKSGEIDSIETKEFLSNEGLNNSSAKLIVKGDLLMALYGANSGEVAISKMEGAINQAIICIRSKENTIYLYNLLLRKKKEIISKYLQGGQGNLSANLIKQLSLIIPPQKEQKAIANCLSTWDKAITKQIQLIRAKQLQKKALAQQLLTGNNRLPRFSEEWLSIKGGELFTSISNKNHYGSFQVLSSTQDRGVIPRDLVGINIKFDKKSLINYKKVEVGNFIISLRSFQGGIEYSNYEGLISPAYTILKEIRPISKDFYKEYLKTQDFIKRLNSIIYGIRDGKQISYKEFATLKILYPPLKEQKAIAKILTTADKEIKVLQQQLEQLKLQKKGLMQLLLTGKKRLV